jgi:hypothetical protein
VPSTTVAPGVRSARQWRDNMRVIDFMKEANDYGTAAEFLATGVQRMFMVSPSIVRISFTRTDIRDDSVEEQRVSGHIDCDIAQIGAIVALIWEGLTALVDQPRDVSRSSVVAH